MAHTVDIRIFLISKSVVLPGAGEWLQHIGAKEYVIDMTNRTDADQLVELAGRRCYMSFQRGLNPNITKIRNDTAEYIENILKSGHGSVLEHATFTFAFEGVSRVFTGEMNRHRAGWAISEGSMRYIRFEDMGYWLPTSIIANPKERDDIQAKKVRTQLVFKKAFEDAEKHYKELQNIWSDELAHESKFSKKKEITSMMRRIVPMGIATGGIWTGNVRAIRHVITMRTTPHAEEEILYVFTNVLRVLSLREPNMFGDFEEVEGGFFVPKYVKV